MRYLKIKTNVLSCLLMFVFAVSCTQQTPEPVRLTEEDNKKVAFVVKSFTTDVSPEDRKKADELFRGFTFNENELFIDLRYKKLGESGEADRAEVEYWRNWSHEVNRKANKRWKKPYTALAKSEMQQIVSQLPEKYKSSPAGKSSSARTTQANCPTWINNTGSFPSVNGAAGTGIQGTYIGRVNFNGNSTDCDYLFRFTIPRIEAVSGMRSDNGFPSAFPLGRSSAARIDNTNPSSDCGTYTVEVMLGDLNLAAFFGNPFDAALFIKIATSRSVKTGWCYTGSWEAEQWHYAGVYSPQWDGWGRGRSSAGWLPCACNEGGWVR